MFLNIETFSQIQLTKSASVSTVDVGIPFTYSIQIKCPSTSGTCNNVVVTDPLPIGLDYLGASSPTGNVQSITYNSTNRTVSILMNPILNGTTDDVQLAVAFKTGTFTNTIATNIAYGGPGNTIPSNSVNVTATNGESPPVFFENIYTFKDSYKEVSPGNGTAYNFMWGNQSATNSIVGLQVLEVLPANFKPTILRPVRYPNAVGFTYNIYYQTNLNASWTLVPGIFNLSDQYYLDLVNSLGVPVNQYITQIRFNYLQNIPGGGTFYGYQAGGEDAIVFGNSINTVPLGTILTNCITATGTMGGIPKSSNYCASNTVTTPNLTVLHENEILNPVSGYLPGDTITFKIYHGTGVTSALNIINPVIVDLLPPELEYISYVAYDGWNNPFNGVPVIPTFTQTLNYNSTGQTLLKWSYNGTVIKTNNAQSNSFIIELKTRVKPGVASGPYKNLSYGSNDNGGIQLTDNWYGWAYPNNYLHYIDTQNLNGVNGTTDSLYSAFRDFNVIFPSGAGLEATKWVKGTVDSDYTRYPVIGRTVPGGTSDYKLQIKNAGSVALKDIKIIDILPFVGDKGVVDLSNRNSQWRPFLVDKITSSNPNIQVYYSTESNPCRNELTPGLPSPCNAPNWSLFPPNDIITVQSLKFDFGNIVMQPNDELIINWPMRTPLNAPTANEIAWNSFGYIATRNDNNTVLSASEPIKVGIQSQPLSQSIIGNYVWNDSNDNGIQDDGVASGINNVKVEIYKPTGSTPNPILDSLITWTLTSNNSSGNPGFYQFSNLNPGDYYLVFYNPTKDFNSSKVNVGIESSDSDGFVNIINGELGTITNIFNLGLGITNFDFDQGFINSSSGITDCGCTGNLLINPSFESGTTGWNMSPSGAFGTGTGYEQCGTVNNGFLNPLGADNWVWQQINGISPGKVYTLRAYAGTHDPNFNHKLYLRFYDSLGNELISPPSENIDFDVDILGNILQKYEITGVAPPNTSYLRVEANSNGDVLKLDHFCLSEVLPCQSVIASAISSSIVEGQTITLIASNGESFIWTGPNGFSSSLQNPIINNATILNSGVYSLTVNSGICISTATISIIVSKETNLGINKTVDNATPNVGSNVTFTLTASNAGPSAATGVTVNDVLPAGYSLVSATPSTGTWTAPNWSIGNLANGGTETLTVIATVNATGSYANTANISGNETDPTPGNNSSTSTPVPVPQTNLGVNKTVDNSTPNVGSNVTFTITASNAGPSAATGVTVNDVLPAGYSLASATPSTGTWTAPNWSIGNLANGGTETLTVIATVNATGSYGNTASITGNETDPTPGNNSSTVTPIPVPQTNLGIVKTASSATPNVGSNVTFTITASNAGPSAATGVTVNDVLPAGYSLVSATPSTGTWTAPNWSIGNLANGGTETLTVIATVNATGSYANTANISGNETDPTPGNNSSTSTPVPVPQTNLGVNKTVDNSTPNVGSNVTFTITASNAGPSAATGVTVNDVLPAGYSLASATPSTGTWTAPNWSIGNLANGGTETLTVIATVNATGSYGNTASITGNETDPTPGNNSSTVTPIPVPQTNLGIVKTASSATPNVGSNVTFTITASNAGPSAATGVTVNDVLPAGYSLVSATPSTGTWTTPNWSIGNLANGGIETLTVIATVNGTGSYANTASITGNETDPTPGNNSSTSTPVPVPQTNLGINKTVDNATPNVGSNVTFTITASNAGPSAATGVTVNDVLPAGYSLVSATPSTGTWTAPNWSIGNLANGGTETLTVIATINATGSYANTANISGNETDPTPGNNSSTVTPVPVPQTNLGVVKTASSATPNVGSNVTFTITASNAGPSAATGVTVNDVLPAGYSLVSSTPSTGTWTAPNWSIGNLANGGSEILTIVATVNATGSYGNTANISGNETDPTPGNNSSTSTPVPNISPEANDDSNGPIASTAGATAINTLSATDTDGTIENYRIETLPTLGTLYVNGTPVTQGQVLTPAQISQLTYDPSGTANGTDSFTFTAIDNNGAEDNTDATISITVSNNAPVANDDSNGPIASTAGATAINTLSATDTDGTIANYRIETLPTLGTLYVNGTPVTQGQVLTPAQISQLTYDPSGTANGTDSFTFTAIDNNGAEDNTDATISITVSNNAPVANDDSNGPIASTAGATAINTLSATDTDGTIANYRIETLPTLGTLYVNGTPVTQGQVLTPAQISQLTYDPSGTANGTDSFTFTAIDNNGAEDNTDATISITVSNNAPVANDDSNGPIASTAGATAINTLTATDTDGTIANYRIETLPTLGTLYVNGTPVTQGQVLTPAQISQLTYDPSGTANGTDSFTFTAIDNNGAEDNTDATISITVSNNAPVANDDSNGPIASTAGATAINTLSATDTDGTIANYRIETLPTLGTLYVNGTPVTQGQVLTPAQISQLTYDPSGTANGTDSFTFTAIDNNGAEDNTDATISITVSNNAPVANDDSNGPIASTAGATAINTLSATDTDGTIANYRIETLPTIGTLYVNGTPVTQGQVLTPAQVSQLTYDPSGTANGTDSFTFTAIDNNGAEDNTDATISITVSNNAPVANDDSNGPIASTARATAINTLTATDTDGTIANYRIETLPTLGTLYVNGTPVTQGQVLTPAQISQLTYDPSGTANGTDSFTFTAIDNNGAEDNTDATISITVSNNAPEANDDSNGPIASTAGATAINILTATDTDGTIANYRIETLPTIGTLYVNGTPVTQGQVLTPAQVSQLTYDPSGTANGTDSFTFTAIDNNGAEDNTDATISITVSNNAPEANDDSNGPIASTAGATAINALTATDTDGTIANYRIETLPTIGTLYVNGTPVTQGQVLTPAQVSQLTYDPSGTANGTDSFTFTAIDNNGAEDNTDATISITVSNNAPEANDDSNGPIASTAGATAINALTATDTDGTIANYRIETLPTIGTLYVNGTPVTQGQVLTPAQVSQLTYDPSGTANGTDSFTFTAIDNNGAEDNTDATISILVVIPTGDLEINKSVSITNPNVNQQVSFTISIVNNGPDTATGVVVYDNLPSGYLLLNSVATSGVYSDSTWLVGNLTNGEIQTLTINAIVLSNGNYLNHAYANGNIIDTNVLNNADSVLTTPQIANLSIDKIVNNPNPIVGDTIQFTIQLINNGPNTATNIELKDLIPNGYSNITNISNFGIFSNDTILWAIPSLSSGSNILITYNAIVKAPVLGTNYLNIAEITNSDQFDPNSTPNNGSSTEDDFATESIIMDSTIPVADAGLDFLKTCSLNINGQMIGDTSELGYSYTWFPTTGLSSANISNPIANPLITTTYVVTKTNNFNGFTDTDSVMVTVDTSAASGYLFDIIPSQTSGPNPLNNGQIQVKSTIDTNHMYLISNGSIYNSGNLFDATLKNIPLGGILINNLPFVNLNTDYTIRIFNTNGCYSDYAVTVMAGQLNCKPEVCIPIVITKTKSEK